MTLSKNVNKKNVLLNWYSLMKKKLRKIRIIFDIENWLWKSNFLNFWHLPYTISQNSRITFDYSWFLAKNLSNFVSLPWKLHNRYCHTWTTMVETHQKRSLHPPYCHQFLIRCQVFHLKKKQEKFVKMSSFC